MPDPKRPSDEVEVFPTENEAIAAAVRESADGEIVVIHAADCRAKPDGEGCTCKPLEVTIGPRA